MAAPLPPGSAHQRADEGAAAQPQLRPAMLRAFGRSTRYEYLFWDGAYRMRGWPILDG